MDDNETAAALKEEGNIAYKNADWDRAIDKYTEAMKLTTNPKDKALYLKNRAAVYLKIDEFQSAIDDCTAALEITSNDPKSLFRRAIAYDNLEQHEKAYTDARKVQSLDPKNTEVQQLLAKLHQIIQDTIQNKNQLSSKVTQMFEILFDFGADTEKRETASSNLIALARENAGSQLLMEQGVLGKLVQLLKGEKNTEVRLGCIRTLSELSKSLRNIKQILRDVGIPFLLDLMNSNQQEIVNSVEYCFEYILSSLSGTDLKKERKANKRLIEDNHREIDSIMAVLTTSLTNRTMTGICRDAVIELLIKNLPYEVLNWVEKFMKIEGLEKLLDIATELKEYKYESAIDITDNTRMTTAICLQKLYDYQYEDKMKQAFIERVEKFIGSKLITNTVEAKVRVIVMLTSLMLGPINLGSVLVGKEGTLQMMLTMAESEDVLQQKVACEALIAAASKKEKCRVIVNEGTDILKKLYNSKNNEIKVRALVGLCKLGSMGGSDAAMKLFAEGASLKLADACLIFLVNPTKDKDLRRWACEGLSYLTLDADVKEKVIEKPVALRSMIELARSGDMNCLYGVITTFVNLCNAYDKQEITEEMIELAKFAKQHIPEEHDLDDKDFIDKRVNILVKEGAVTALVALAKTESTNSKELISRLFLAFCEQQELRGSIVQQGGVKTLLHLSMNGTPEGKVFASHALARIAITINPEISFPGQKVYEVVRPLLSILEIENTGLQNFEALMGLCNIAGMSESARQRMIKEKCFLKIEHFMFEHHDMIRRAAFQVMANMCLSPDVVKILEGPNDKLKYIYLTCSDEDEEIILASTGAMCMLLPQSAKLRNKLFEAIDWNEILKFLLSHPNKDIQYRGTIIVYYLVCHDRTMAQKVIESHCKDALEAIHKIDHPEHVHPQAREYAIDTLKICHQYDLIDDPLAKDD